jgi:hypothetical protein
METHSDKDAADPADKASLNGLFDKDLRAFATSRSDESIVLLDDGKDSFHDMEVGREIGVHEHDVIAIGLKEAMFDVVTFAEFVFVRKNLHMVIEFGDPNFSEADVLLVTPIDDNQKLVIDA